MAAIVRGAASAGGEFGRFLALERRRLYFLTRMRSGLPNTFGAVGFPGPGGPLFGAWPGFGFACFTISSPLTGVRALRRGTVNDHPERDGPAAPPFSAVSYTLP